MKNWLPYKDVKEIILREAEKYGINNQKKWFEYMKSEKRLNCIPYEPHKVYRNKGWISFGHWLGTGNSRGCSRKYSVNENFFKKWSSDMAYILGFWFADGCIRNRRGSKTFTITQHKNDKYILEKFLQKMESNHPLVKIRNCFEMTIGSKKIFDDIVNLGGKIRKSLDVEFPEVPKEYLHDFIRGYFDGDGCIYQHENRYRVTFVCGSLKFLERLNEILSVELSKYNHGMKINYSGKIVIVKERRAWISGKYCKFSQNYRLNLSVNDTRRIRDFMYCDPNCIKLKRKYDKFILSGNVRQIGGRVIGAKNKIHKSQTE
jgi:hypothetical protein